MTLSSFNKRSEMFQVFSVSYTLLSCSWLPCFVFFSSERTRCKEKEATQSIICLSRVWIFLNKKLRTCYGKKCRPSRHSSFRCPCHWIWVKHSQIFLSRRNMKKTSEIRADAQTTSPSVLLSLVLFLVLRTILVLLRWACTSSCSHVSPIRFSPDLILPLASFLLRMILYPYPVFSPSSSCFSFIGRRGERDKNKKRETHKRSQGETRYDNTRDTSTSRSENIDRKRGEKRQLQRTTFMLHCVLCMCFFWQERRGQHLWDDDLVSCLWYKKLLFSFHFFFFLYLMKDTTRIFTERRRVAAKKSITHESRHILFSLVIPSLLLLSLPSPVSFLRCPSFPWCYCREITVFEPDPIAWDEATGTKIEEEEKEQLLPVRKRERERKKEK